MTREQLTMMALALADGEPLTPVQLQKAVFLLQNKLGIVADGYDFYPYNYGPFSASVYDDATTMAQSGAVNITNNISGHFREYALTGTGRKDADSVMDQLDPAMLAEAKGLVNKVRSLSFKALCEYVYDEYPEYAKNSLLRKDHK